MRNSTPDRIPSKEHRHQKESDPADIRPLQSDRRKHRAPPKPEIISENNILDIKERHV